MRKLILLCAAFCCITTLASAQIAKGRISLQGSASYNSVGPDDLSASTLAIRPQVGFFIADNISIGPNLGYSRQSRDRGILPDFVSNEFQFGAFARFHKTVADNFYLFLEPSFLFGTGDIEGDVNNNTDINSFDFSIRPGLSYFLSERFAMELNLTLFAYNSRELEGGNNFEINNTVIGTNFSNVGIGLNYFLK